MDWIVAAIQDEFWQEESSSYPSSPNVTPLSPVESTMNTATFALALHKPQFILQAFSATEGWGRPFRFVGCNSNSASHNIITLSSNECTTTKGCQEDVEDLIRPPHHHLRLVDQKTVSLTYGGTTSQFETTINNENDTIKEIAVNRCLYLLVEHSIEVVYLYHDYGNNSQVSSTDRRKSYKLVTDVPFLQECPMTRLAHYKKAQKNRHRLHRLRVKADTSHKYCK
eukprot:TRINITY_DN13120_c0_g1_i1.p1 TRINITY_DN13120_c0_g1~~TRINITY_DN13120_c0_g1_i1.p1  ORF type:complete len:225 (-),score=40.30 TRINITY_DN13120_c0_g1_i1:87-761(-)